MDFSLEVFLKNWLHLSCLALNASISKTIVMVMVVLMVIVMVIVVLMVIVMVMVVLMVIVMAWLC